MQYFSLVLLTTLRGAKDPGYTLCEIPFNIFNKGYVYVSLYQRLMLKEQQMHNTNDA